MYSKLLRWYLNRDSEPFASAGAYVKFMTEEEGDRVATVYGSNYERLLKIENQ
ncbi:MAG: BBE domain-containing protein [Xenococcus sp. (in: cyanobacteria)]